MIASYDCTVGDCRHCTATCCGTMTGTCSDTATVYIHSAPSRNDPGFDMDAWLTLLAMKENDARAKNGVAALARAAVYPPVAAPATPPAHRIRMLRCNRKGIGLRIHKSN